MITLERILEHNFITTTCSASGRLQTLSSLHLHRHLSFLSSYSPPHPHHPACHRPSNALFLFILARPALGNILT